ncbi:MAG: helix-turn-helix domain-containing protein [Clostridia bacterium]|nr:helix-turn-helix domain-containing protein [Clostridia bacterium]MBP5269360.1 helix-turn-helix domain-containing protein [Clostridia bacterium]
MNEKRSGQPDNRDLDIIYLTNRHSTVIEKLPREEIYFDWLVFMLEGSVDYQINGEVITLTPGYALFAPTGSVRERKEQHTSAHYISFQYIRNFAEPKIARCFSFRNNSDLHAVLEMLTSNYLSLSGANDISNSYYIMLIISLCEKISTQGDYHPAVYAMIDYILKNLERKITVPEMAKKIGMSASHCNYIFKQNLGMTVGQYISETRLNLAQNELRNTRHSVQRIAAQVGYEDEFYFSRWFKKKTGLSPLYYRKTAAAEGHKAAESDAPLADPDCGAGPDRPTEGRKEKGHS